MCNLEDMWYGTVLVFLFGERTQLTSTVGMQGLKPENMRSPYISCTKDYSDFIVRASSAHAMALMFNNYSKIKFA